MTTPLSAVEGTSRGLDLVSGKWTILVVFALHQKPRRLSELQRAIPGASARMLVQRLRRLERHGLLRRTVHPVVPPRVDYELTELGRSLLDPLVTLCRWTDEHWAEMERAAAVFDAGTDAGDTGQTAAESDADA